MGLDMYLTARKYISQYYNKAEYKRFKKLFPGREVDFISFEVGYWRKANAIHNWFVQNCQEGVDECQTTYVDRDDLKKLLKIVKTVLRSRHKAMDLLPPVSGFFFGSTDIDQYYWDDLANTKKILEDALNRKKYGKYHEFYYHASW